MQNENAPQGAPYYERQHFAAWVYFVLGAVAFAGAIPFLFGQGWSQTNRTTAHIAIALSIVAALPLCLNILRMHTSVTRDMLYIRFGILFPMLWKHILLADIVEVRAVAYRPLRDAGGWGWRYGKFDGNSTWFFNARGDKGVLIVTRDNRRYIIGSQQPDALKTALDNACTRVL